MGIRFTCPNGHKLNVKEFQAGRRGICPFCGARIEIPMQSTRPSGKGRRAGGPNQSGQDVGDSQSSDSAPDILPGEPPSLPGDPPGRLTVGPSTPIASAAVAKSAVVAPPTTPAVATKSPLGVGTAAKAGLGNLAMPNANAASASPRPNLVNANLVNANLAITPAKQQTPSPGLAPGLTVPPPTQESEQPTSAAEPPDPIAEAPEMIWYVRPPSGGQFGPAPGELMRSWLTEGRVSADSLVWREGWHDWLDAGSVFPKLRGNQFMDFLDQAPAIPDAPISNPAVMHAPHPNAQPKVDRTFIALIGLTVAVVVLLVVFLWILFHNPGP